MIDALEFKNELPDIILITVSIKEMNPMSIELTDPMKKSIPKIVDTVLALCC
jgi:Ni,Fe-hydrogenase maturation factor